MLYQLSYTPSIERKKSAPGPSQPRFEASASTPRTRFCKPRSAKKCGGPKPAAPLGRMTDRLVVQRDRAEQEATCVVDGRVGITITQSRTRAGEDRSLLVEGIENTTADTHTIRERPVS